MNNSKNLGLYATVIAVSVGILGAYGFSMNPSTLSNAPSTTDVAPILGHVTITVTDPNGHIKQYLQGDNTVQMNGKDCVGRFLFGAGSTVCTSVPTGTFTTIAISATNTGAGTFPDNQDSLPGEYGTGIGLARTDATGTSATWTDATHNGHGQEVVKATFTNTGTSTTVNAAGLFNSTTVQGTGNMFAAQDFPSGVTLATNDAITVQWTIQVG